MAVFCFTGQVTEGVTVVKKKVLPQWTVLIHELNTKDAPLKNVLHALLPDNVYLDIDDEAGEQPISYHGTTSIENLLESLDKQVFWKAEENRLVVRGFIVKEYEIPQFPVQYRYNQDYLSGISKTSETGSGQDKRTSSKVSLSATQDFWKNIKGEIEAILWGGSQSSISRRKQPLQGKIVDSSSYLNRPQESAGSGVPVGSSGGRTPFVAINPITSVIMVGGTVDRVALVDTYLEKITSRLTKTVEISLSILEVSESRGSEYSFDWTTTLRNVINLNTDVFLARTSETVLSLFGRPPEGMSQNYGVSFGSFTDSDRQNFILHALKTVADVDILEKTSILLRNNTAGGFSTGTVISYIDSVQKSVSGGTGTSDFSVTKGTVLNGIDVIVSATINGDLITITLLPQLSTLKGMETLDFGNGSLIIQNPTVDIRKSIATVTVRNGETTAIVGYNQRAKNIDRSQFPVLGDIPVVGWLFGSRKTGKSNASIVMLLTPVIKDVGSLKGRYVL